MSNTPSTPQQNKMGYMPINRLLITMALPMMISMLVQALYNVVDSIFVARLSEDALTAVSLAFPVQSVMIALGVGTGVGVNALLSKSLGEKNFEQVNRTATNGLFLSLCNTAVIMLFGFFGLSAFFHAQTDDAVILTYCMDYMTIVTLFSLGIFVQVMSERLLVSTGKTSLSMCSQMTGAIINIILDPIMIFGLLGCPAFGVKGAAMATVIGQWCGAITSIVLNLHFNSEIKLSFKGFRPHMPTIKRIYAVGLPSIIMQSVSSVMTFCLNSILISFSSTAVAVFGIYFKLQSFIFMPVFGLNNGMVPIVSFNYGARNADRMSKTIRQACVYSFCIMTAGAALFMGIPHLLLSMFSASDTMLEIGTMALRIIGVHFPMAAFSIIFISVFQALGRGVWAMIASLGRQLGVLIPAAWLLSRLGRLELVWLAFPIAEIVGVSLCTYFMTRINKEVIQPLKNNTPATDNMPE